MEIETPLKTGVKRPPMTPKTLAFPTTRLAFRIRCLLVAICSIIPADALRAVPQDQPPKNISARTAVGGVKPKPPRKPLGRRKDESNIKNIRAMLLDTHFKIMRSDTPNGKASYENFLKQLRELLQQGLTVPYTPEIGGSLFLKDGQLVLKPVESVNLQEILKALERFESRSYKSQSEYLKDVRILKERAELAGELSKQQFNGSMHRDIKALITYFEAVEYSGLDPKNQQTDQKAAKLFRKLVLPSLYTFRPKDMGITEKGFLGVWHVHWNGTPPSPADIATEGKNNFPILVFSADRTTETVTIYLIKDGKISVLLPEVAI